MARWLIAILFCGGLLGLARADDQVLVRNQLQSSDIAYAQGNYVAAMLLVRPLAEAGNREAQHKLGVLYAEGRGLDQNHAEAVAWFRKSAEQGYPNALHSLGLVYAKGEGVAADPAEAFKWLLLARRGWSGSQWGAMAADGIQKTTREASVLLDRFIVEGRIGALRQGFQRAREWQETHSVLPQAWPPYTYQDFLFMTAGEAARYCEPWFESLRDAIGKTLARLRLPPTVRICSARMSAKFALAEATSITFLSRRLQPFGTGS